MPKPRVLLIPNNTQWILGYMSRRIQEALGAEYEFFIVPETLFEARPTLLDRLLPEIDLVHCMNESGGRILALRGGSLPPILSWIHHVTAWSADHAAACAVSSTIIACTEGWKRRIGEFTGKPIHVVRAGVDPVEFQRVAGSRARWGIPETDFVLGFFGSKGSDSDNNRKGMDTFLEVARRCGAAIPNLRILLLGPGWDTDVARFEAAGIRVTYPGFMAAAELPAAYSALDVYLMTARVEGGPVTVLEAMACGTPVVATRVGLVPDVVVDGENGFSAEVGDVEALSAAVRLLADDAGLRVRVSAKARATAEELTWARLLAPLGGIYASLLPGGSTARRSLSPERVNRVAVGAEAVLRFRYALRAGGKAMGISAKWKGLQVALRASGGPATFVRAVRMAARGQV